MKKLLIAAALMVLPLSAFAQTWPVNGPIRVCEPTGNCDRGNFAFNFEGEGVTVSLQALGLTLNPESGKWEGRGSFEVRDGNTGAQIVVDPLASFAIAVVAINVGSECAYQSAVGSIAVNGVAVGAGQFFSLSAVRGPESSPFGCAEAQLVGSLTVAQGKGNARKAARR